MSDKKQEVSPQGTRLPAETNPEGKSQTKGVFRHIKTRTQARRNAATDKARQKARESLRDLNDAGVELEQAMVRAEKARQEFYQLSTIAKNEYERVERKLEFEAFEDKVEHAEKMKNLKKRVDALLQPAPGRQPKRSRFETILKAENKIDAEEKEAIAKIEDAYKDEDDPESQEEKRDKIERIKEISDTLRTNERAKQHV